MNYRWEIFTIIFRPLRPLRPFDFAQDMLCGRYSDSFGCGFAALGLCGDPPPFSPQAVEKRGGGAEQRGENRIRC
jgi:hypothetical protein